MPPQVHKLQGATLVLQFVLSGFIAGAIYALIALGFTVIYRTVKFFNFAHGMIYTVGAYFAYTFAIQFGLNPVVSFFLPLC
jgi:branched-chain amino acid transport system permease protein